VNGLDFNGVYTRNTVVGEVTASVGGTLDLNRTNALAGSAPVDELAANLSALQWVASLGTRYGGFTAQVRVNYSAGYTLTGITGQNHVDSFHPVDLFFAYELSGTGLWSNTTLTLNIDNVGDERPPFYNSATSGDYGVTNGSTYGRLATLGLHKGF
jgi:iron complex outermembrane receptor protein